MSKLINCKDCGNQVSKNAAACPNCGAKIKRTSVLTWVAAIFIGLLVFSSVMSINSVNTPSVEPDALASASSEPAVVEEAVKGDEDIIAEPPTIASNWQYDESVDEMRGESSYFAINKSTNAATLDFPYGEGVELSIIIRDDAQHGQDILFAVNKGQLFCSYQDCYVSVKFDDGAVQKFTTTEAEAGSSEVLFLAEDVASFVEKLKNSDMVMVEVNFFDHGNEQFKFNVSGLEWSRF